MLYLCKPQNVFEYMYNQVLPSSIQASFQFTVCKLINQWSSPHTPVFTPVYSQSPSVITSGHSPYHPLLVLSLF